MSRFLPLICKKFCGNKYDNNLSIKEASTSRLSLEWTILFFNELKTTIYFYLIFKLNFKQIFVTSQEVLTQNKTRNTKFFKSSVQVINVFTFVN